MVQMTRGYVRAGGLTALLGLVGALLIGLPGLGGHALAATPVMGPSAVTADELADWYATTGQKPDLPISVRQLAGYFIQEGAAEGVRGDIAFAQSILETGYFTFPSGGQVRPSHNNYGGLGAVDGGNSPNSFRSPQIGVRAQIQHLRAYADPTVTEANLAFPLESPRFHLVSPKGRAPTWEDMGGVAPDGKVNWASDPQYGAKILDIFGRITRFVEQRRDGIPIAGDWNGDGRATPGWYRSGRVFLLPNRIVVDTAPPLTALVRVHPKEVRASGSGRVALHYRLSERAQPLLGVSDENVLNNRALRNSLAHFDERLEEWFSRTGGKMIIDHNVAAMVPADRQSALRHLMPDRMIYIFESNEYDMRSISAAVSGIHAAATAALMGK
jgi:hypothetical protein